MFALAFVYAASNIGLFVFYRREHRDQFSWAKHLLIPAVGIIALAVVVYYPVNPLPAWPVSLGPVHRAGLAVVGAIVVAAAYRGDRAGNLAPACAATAESVEDAIVSILGGPSVTPPTWCADVTWAAVSWPSAPRGPPGGPRERVYQHPWRAGESSVCERRA